MTREEEIQQLLSSVSGILDDAMEHMAFKFQYVIVADYPQDSEIQENQLMANCHKKYVEQMLLDAIKASHSSGVKIIKEGAHLQ